MNPTFKYLIFNAGLWGLLYLDLQGVAGAMNLFNFIIWFAFIVVLLLQSSRTQLKLIQDEATSFLNRAPATLRTFNDFVMMGVLIWFGHWVLAIVILMTFVLFETAAENIKQLKQRPTEGIDV